MTSVRVHELAKELNLSSKEVIAKLQAMGVDVKNNLSAVDIPAAERLRAQIEGSPAREKVQASPEPHTATPRKGTTATPEPAKAVESPERQPGALAGTQVAKTEPVGATGKPNRPLVASRPVSTEALHSPAETGPGVKQRPIAGSQPQRTRPAGDVPAGTPRPGTPRPGAESRPVRPEAEGQRPIRPVGPDGRPLPPRPLGPDGRPLPPRPLGPDGRPLPPRPGTPGARPVRPAPPAQPGSEGTLQGPEGRPIPPRPGQAPRPGMESRPQGPRPGQIPRPGQEGHPQGPRPGQAAHPGVEGRPQGPRPGQIPRPGQEGHPQGPRPGHPPHPGMEGRPQGPRPGQIPRPDQEGHPQGPRPGQVPRPGMESRAQGPRPGQIPRPGQEGYPQGPRFGQIPRPGMEGRPQGPRPGPTQRPGAEVPGAPGARPGQAQRPAGARPARSAAPAAAQTAEQAKRPGQDKKKSPDKSFERKREVEKDLRVQKRPGRSDVKEVRDTAPKHIVIPETISVQDLAAKMSRKASELIMRLMNLGVMATINQELDAETATILASELGVTVEVKAEKSLAVIEEVADDPADLRPRSPVVTVMGHVDHGKTSLLDAIRLTNVTASEAGGITQHIGAYQVEINGQKITFLDTPGHEAFTAMRARGAQVTDIVVLVVAADDGVMPQTVEAINHAKAAGVPIIVAINKIDKENAQPDRVKQELTEYGLVVEEWGGDTIAVPVSAKTKHNIEQLLEMILLVAEVRELKANPNRPAVGTVIEAELDKGKGPVATVLVAKGTLNIGDVAVAGTAFGRIRAMTDDKGRRVKKAGPAVPVEVQGLSEVPPVGEQLTVVADEKLARQIVAARASERRIEEAKQTAKVSLEDLFDKIKEGEVKDLNLIIKADVQGSVEALRSALERLSTSEVRVNPIHGGVGAITETDVMLAAASNAIIIGFNVRPDSNTKATADIQGVDVRLYRVIYDAIEDVKAAMTGLLAPEFREVVLGKAEVRQVFRVPKIGAVAGSFVSEGKVMRNAKARVVRDGIVVHEGAIESLRRFKDDVREVAEGYECGIGIERFNDLKEGDIIEAFVVEEVKRQL